MAGFEPANRRRSDRQMIAYALVFFPGLPLLAWLVAKLIW
jgi:hypothetical protein